MKLPNRLVSIEERDRLLNEFYNNRLFLQFVHGEEYFNNKIEELFGLWLKGPIGKEQWGNDLIIERTSWEYDNGYLD